MCCYYNRKIDTLLKNTFSQRISFTFNKHKFKPYYYNQEDQHLADQMHQVVQRQTDQMHKVVQHQADQTHPDLKVDIKMHFFIYLYEINNYLFI